MSRLEVSVLSYSGSSNVCSMLITLRPLESNDIRELRINRESTACEFMKVQPRNRRCTFTEYRSNALAQASRGRIERFADGFAGNEQFNSPVLLTAGGIIVGGNRQTIAKASGRN